MTNHDFIIEQFNKRKINISPTWIKKQTFNNFPKFYELFLNTEIEKSCLPPTTTENTESLKSCKKTTLFESGKVLQIIDIIDASKSLFQQVEQLKGIEDMNEAAELNLEPTQKQVVKHNFKLTLTDGKNEYLGFEYEMINDLRLDISLGTKIEVRNVNTIRGMLMLTPKNCKVLGGHVVSLNTIHPILRIQRKLRGPDFVEKSYVERSYFSKTQSQNNSFNSSYSGPSTQPYNNSNNNSYATDQSVLTAVSLPSVNNTTIINDKKTVNTTTASTSKVKDPFDEFDDTFIDMIADQYEETSNNNQPSTSTTNQPSTSSKTKQTKDPFDEFEDSFIHRIADEYDVSKDVIDLDEYDALGKYDDDDLDAFVDS